jgi:eukaryotic-like serine/threonine-protein kinase
MAQHDRCPKCGAERSEGVCPRCLLGLGINGPGPGPSRLSSKGESRNLSGELTTGTSVLDSIAATIGHVPRVLLHDIGPGEEPGPIVRPQGPDGADRSIRYRIDGEIARGGMGAILKGRDPDLGRDVALKVLREDHRDNADMVRRFVEEAQIGGQLQHPGIVPIYELGTFTDRRPFFSMKLVKGHTLAQMLESRRLSGPMHKPEAPAKASAGEPSLALQACEESAAADLPRFLSIFEAIAQTIAYAHARGVIHRDLKPSNVMVGSFGEVQVMDWGLAKVLPRGGVVADAQAGKTDRQETLIATARSGSDVSDLSHAGSVMGTPSYMAPEQARGEVDRIDERADVFALGSILCEILTGEPVFLGRSSGEIQRKAALGDLGDALARLDACGADADLVALAKVCLAYELEDRPRSAGGVTERVTAYLTGVQEKLRRAELDRVEERARRRLTTVTATALLLLGLAGCGGYVWNQEQKAQRVRKTARAVDEALADAARLRGEAQAAPADEMAHWAEALSAAKRAEGLLAQGEADAPLRGRVSDLLAQLRGEQAAAADKGRRLEADHALLADLDSVRGGRAEDRDVKHTDAEYAAAFRKAGLDVDATEPAEAGKWLAARSEPVELAGYLDDWTYIRINAERPEADWRRLVAVARAADHDPWRDTLRARLATKDAEAVAEFRRLADDDRALDGQPAPSLILLARQLKEGVGDRERAAQMLRRAVLRHPADFWAHFELSRVFGTGIGRLDDYYPRPEEAVRHLTAALAVRPRSRMAHLELALALSAQGKLDDAVAVCREALRLKPDDAMAHQLLGCTLLWQGKFDEAVAEEREAIRLEPNFANYHFQLGNALANQNKHDEAVAEYHAAIRLSPPNAWYRTDLGNALWAQGKLDDAVVEFHEAIRLKPDYAEAHVSLGNALWAQGKLDDAVAEDREAIRLKPHYAEAHCNLGRELRSQGDYPASLAAFRRGHELGIKQPGWRYPSAQWVAQAERMVALAPRLLALSKGEDRPKKNDERLDVVQMCSDTKRFAAAARFWAEAMKADPKLGEDRQAYHRYNAACAAALAAAGKDVDDPSPNDVAKANLRGQALTWLKAELAAWAKFLDADGARAQPVVIQMLQHWKVDTDLAGVRDALSKLPESERKPWQALWADVDALLNKARSGRS